MVWLLFKVYLFYHVSNIYFFNLRGNLNGAVSSNVVSQTTASQMTGKESQLLVLLFLLKSIDPGINRGIPSDTVLY